MTSVTLSAIVEVLKEEGRSDRMLKWKKIVNWDDKNRS